MLLQDISTSQQQLNPVFTALIAAGAAISGVVLKDFVFRRWDRQQEKSADLAAVYARYAEPLSSASVSLMWRLKQIFEEPGRAGFLKVATCGPVGNKYAVYGHYKKVSTLYRLAVLLAWVRACRRDFHSLRVADAKAALPVEQAFARIESALADGPEVELQRLEGLGNLWNIKLTDNRQLRSALGIAVESAIDSKLKTFSSDDLTCINEAEKQDLLRSVSLAITGGLRVKPISEEVLKERSTLALDIIGIREAWIYREWQSAIGDFMLQRVEGASRPYEVISFSNFETYCTSGNEEQNKWIGRLSEVFDGVDVAVRDPYDHRYKQLHDLLTTTAALVLALSSCLLDHNLPRDSVSEAHRLSVRKLTADDVSD